MDETDTKPMETVQVALSLFGQKSDSTRYYSDSDGERERDVQHLEKDLASYKLQLEAKDTIQKQLLLELEQCKKTAERLAVILKNTESERDKQIEECNNVKDQVDELECKIQQMADQLLETADIREQLSRVFDELNVTQTELLNSQTELAAAREAEHKAKTTVELLEADASMEKNNSEEFLRQISGLHNSVLTANMEISKLEREKHDILANKEAEMEIMTANAIHAQEQLEDSTVQLEMMIALESQLLEKSQHVEALQTEVKQAKDALTLMEGSTSDVQEELNRTKEDLERQRKKNLEQASYIEALETELQQARQEMENANEDLGRLSRIIETLSEDLMKALKHMEDAKHREQEAKEELVLLKAEINRARSKVAAAEAARARAQQLVIEAEEAKKEMNKLKNRVESEESNSNVTVDVIKGTMEESGVIHETSSNDKESEIEALKKELEAAGAKIGEFRMRTQQAITRAEAAEGVKFGLEERIRKLQEQRQRRKAALIALREESATIRSSPPATEMIPSKDPSLGKFLKITRRFG